MLIASLLACSSSDCTPLDGVDALLASRTVVVGEMHGTVESPAVAGEVACHAVQAGKPVLLALELPVSEQERAQAALASGDRAALVSGPFWTRAEQDGRSSGAIADLVLRAHAWKAAGKPVELATFALDTSPEGGPNAGEKAMADALSTAMAAHPDATVVVLTGNLHGRRAAGVPWDPSFRPLASRLQGSVTSVLVRAVNGSAWNCQQGECKAFTFGDGSAPATTPVVKRLDPPEDGYDAVVEVGRFTASPPAVPSPAP